MIIYKVISNMKLFFLSSFEKHFNIKKQFKDKIRLFRLIHNINWLYISTTGKITIKKPQNFTGKSFEWWFNGVLSQEESFKNGEHHGHNLGWHPNGQKAFKYNYRNGELHGKNIEWHDDGKLFLESNYKNGKYHGIIRWESSLRSTPFLFFKEKWKNGIKIWQNY